MLWEIVTLSQTKYWIDYEIQTGSRVMNEYEFIASGGKNEVYYEFDVFNPFSDCSNIPIHASLEAFRPQSDDKLSLVMINWMLSIVFGILCKWQLIVRNDLFLQPQCNWNGLPISNVFEVVLYFGDQHIEKLRTTYVGRRYEGMEPKQCIYFRSFEKEYSIRFRAMGIIKKIIPYDFSVNINYSIQPFNCVDTYIQLWDRSKLNFPTNLKNISLFCFPHRCESLVNASPLSKQTGRTEIQK